VEGLGSEAIVLETGGFKFWFEFDKTSVNGLESRSKI
jgi:hypothetical protein